jgi:ADP-heptose:LPS heptosyltransferase
VQDRRDVSQTLAVLPALAECFNDVVVVGTADDLRRFDGSPMRFPDHSRSLVGTLSLRETAEVLAGAAVVVANDSGLGHVAAAVGTPTVLLFGPTPDAALGRLPPNVTVLRAGLQCEPCWRGARLARCARRVDCLAALSTDRVEAAVRARATLLPSSHREERM